jgi:hypothetical protein
MTASGLGCAKTQASAARVEYLRGIPATERDPLVALRMPKDMIAALDWWASQQGRTRSELIRELLAAGLRSK